MSICDKEECTDDKSNIFNASLLVYDCQVGMISNVMKMTLVQIFNKIENNDNIFDYTAFEGYFQMRYSIIDVVIVKKYKIFEDDTISFKMAVTSRIDNSFTNILTILNITINLKDKTIDFYEMVTQ